METVMLRFPDEKLWKLWADCARETCQKRTIWTESVTSEIAEMKSRGKKWDTYLSVKTELQNKVDRELTERERAIISDVLLASSRLSQLRGSQQHIAVQPRWLNMHITRGGNHTAC
jgi:hypothetical protein